VSRSAGRTLAQAKVNLALRILGREPDGYHSIETVFLRLELGDDILVRVTDGRRSLRCDAMHGEMAEDNLAYRAAALYAEETGWPRGFEIEIGKRIPIGGGLGGGSSDAAAVLRILSKLSPRPISPPQLLDLAGQIGSDVPFLASDSVMALAWGRGEKLMPLPPLPPRNISLFLPGYEMSTAEAYASLARARGSYPTQARRFTAKMFGSWEETARNSVNDFEAVVSDDVPFVAGWLENGVRFGVFTRMTGSGSTVFQIDDVRTGTGEPPSLMYMALGGDTRVLETRTADSVVPVDVLD